MRWRLLLHPSFTGSVAVLAVNDHVLKGRLPGILTGKLSDYTIAGPLIAGLSLVVFLASVLVAILPTRRSSPEAT